jgi:hypothetical protein
LTKGQQKSNREKRKPKAEQAKSSEKKLPSYMSGDSGLGSAKAPGSPVGGVKGRK